MPFAPPYIGVQAVMCLLGRARGCGCSTGAQRHASSVEGPQCCEPHHLVMMEAFGGLLSHGLQQANSFKVSHASGTLS